MILFELTETEQHASYQELEISNAGRQYDFLRSIIRSALSLGKQFLSQTIIKALNFHAICCLHTNAGEYRPCDVHVGTIRPPEHYRVQAAMDDFVNTVNRIWDRWDAIDLTCYVLWRLNLIHPFINGNGRTARAACYYVLCLKSGGILPGSPMLPELLKQNHDEYIAALRAADAGGETGSRPFPTLSRLLERLIGQQLKSAGVIVGAPPTT